MELKVDASVELTVEELSQIVTQAVMAKHPGWKGVAVEWKLDTLQPPDKIRVLGAKVRLEPIPPVTQRG